MKRSLGQNTFFVYFRYFLKVGNKLQGYFCPSSNINPPYYTGVDIRPQLVIQSIPGLYFSGAKTKISPKNVLVDYVAAEDSDKDANETEGLSITDSTTSKFEAVERKVEERSRENEIKARLRQKVWDILTEKYSLKVKNEGADDEIVPVRSYNSAKQKDKKTISPPRDSSLNDFAVENVTGTSIQYRYISSENMTVPERDNEAERDTEAEHYSLRTQPEEEAIVSRFISEDNTEPNYSGSFEVVSSESSNSLSPSGTGTEKSAVINAAENPLDNLDGKIPEEFETNGVELEKDDAGKSDDMEIKEIIGMKKDEAVEVQDSPRWLYTIDEVSSTMESGSQEAVSSIQAHTSFSGQHEAPEPEKTGPASDQACHTEKDAEIVEDTSVITEPLALPVDVPEGETHSLPVSSTLSVLVPAVNVLEENQEVAVIVSVSEQKGLDTNVSVGFGGLDQVQEIIPQNVSLNVTSTEDPGSDPLSSDRNPQQYTLVASEHSHDDDDFHEQSLQKQIVNKEQVIISDTGSGSGGYGRTYVKSHLSICFEDDDNMNVNMNISQGDLTSDDEELEKEEDLETTAPSILLDSEGPGAVLESHFIDPAEQENQPSKTTWSSDETASSLGFLSAGEVLVPQAAKSEGEVGSATIGSDGAGTKDNNVAPPSGPESSDLSEMTSTEPSVRVRKNKKRFDTNLLRSSQLRHSPANSSSSLSEGEWRASPRQLQRFYNMSSAFGLLNQN
jgi:hypothetical protein